MLGLILFTLYTAALGDICRKHCVSFHAYVDDQQIYLSIQEMREGSRQQCMDRIQNSIHGMHWLIMFISDVISCDKTGV